MNVDWNWKGWSAFSWLPDYLELTWYDWNWLEYLRLPWLCDNFRQLNWFVTFSIFSHIIMLRFGFRRNIVLIFNCQPCFQLLLFLACKLLFPKIIWNCFCGLKIFMIQFWELSGVFCLVYIFRWIIYCLNFMIIFVN